MESNVFPRCRCAAAVTMLRNVDDQLCADAKSPPHSEQHQEFSGKQCRYTDDMLSRLGLPLSIATLCKLV